MTDRTSAPAAGTKARYAATGPEPGQEEARLAALARYAVLDTGAEAGFDDLAQLAAEICDTPVGLVTFVDDIRQFFKARFGPFDSTSSPLDAGFCTFVVRTGNALIIPDTVADPAYAGNPAVAGAGVRFYAGVPLLTPDGHVVGALCVVDHVPRPGGLSERQRRALGALAAQTMSQLELRRAEATARRARAGAEQMTRRLAVLAEASARLMASTDPRRAVEEIHGLIAPELGLDMCLHYVCGGDGGLRVGADAGITPEQRATVERIEFGETICGMVAKTRAPVHRTGIRGTDDPAAALLHALNIDTYHSAPLIADGELLGTVAFGRKGPAFTPGELDLLATLAANLASALERLRAHRTAMALASRRAFLLDLGDRTRLLADPGAIVAATTRALGQELGASRVVYAEMDEAAGTAAIRPGWTDGTAPALPETVRLADFGAMARLRAGETLWVADTAAHPDTADAREALDAIGVRAVVSVPLLKHGRFVANLNVLQAVPRAWSDDEVELIEAVAERTWEALERARAEAALRESEARFRHMADSAPALIWMTDARGKVVFANMHYEYMFGHPATAMLGQGWQRHVVAEDLLAYREAFRSAFRAHATFRAETRVRDRDGRVRWVRCEAVPRLGDTGSFLGYTGCAVDITEARLAAEELESRVEARTAELMAAEAALRQSQKMEAVGQLTGGIAHDFNNMLQAIGSSLELMLRRAEQGRMDEAGRLAEGARRTVERAAALTHRLLAFARRQTLQPKTVDPGALVDGMAELIRRTVGPGVAVELRLGDGGPVQCDPSQLESALLNLAINARDAMPDGGTLAIGVASVCLGAADLIGQEGAEQEEAAHGEYTEISVADTGTGMTPGVLARVFEPFFTTKPIGQGTGLGLSQVYGFVRQSSGMVRLDSAPGQGTTVRLRLPRQLHAGAGDEPGTGGAAVSRAPQAAGGGGTLLLVEDEAAVRAVAAEHLRELGYAVLEAEDGAGALRALNGGGTVDLLVTDVGLTGGLNGRQVADAARERRPGLPVLFITGYTGGALDEQLAPGMAVIGKPFTLEALAERVGAMVETAAAG